MEREADLRYPPPSLTSSKTLAAYTRRQTAGYKRQASFTGIFD